MKKARGLKQCYEAWRNITSDHTVLEAVKGMKIGFTEMTINCMSSTHLTRFNSSECEVIDGEIQNLLKKNMIRPCPNVEGEIISNIFLRPKKDGSHRLILNLKNLNQFAEYKHFKMDSLHTILRLMKKGCYMASLDIKDTYYTIPVDETYQKYLKFRWRTQLYCFTCLPNGLGPCPRRFTKVLKPPPPPDRSEKDGTHLLSPH